MDATPTGAFPVLLEGYCYDIKKFLRDHPGGLNTLKNYKGKSILDAMEKLGHSSSAYHILNDFKIGASYASDVNLTGGVSANGRIYTKEEASRNVEEIKFLEHLESRLDYSQPILAQLHLIQPHYELWVNSAVFRRCRLFANPFLEILTFTPWYAVLVFWIPVILYLGYTQFVEHVCCGETCESPLTAIQFVYHLIAGVFIWTGLEYMMHRWIFHRDPGNNLMMIKMHFLLHGLHHKMPFDGLRQVFPPVPALVITYIIYLIISRPLFAFPIIKCIGGLCGYVVYDMIHYYVHHGAPTAGSYLYAMKRYHSNHHFVNHDRAFGISTEIWDHVFQTFVQSRNTSQSQNRNTSDCLRYGRELA